MHAHATHQVPVGDHRIQARVVAPRGIAPARTPVVLVHGLGVSSRYLVPLLEELGSSHRTWAPDLPGHGRSSTPDHTLSLDELARTLGAWLDGTAIERPLLVANSYGCQVVVELARARPVTGLVLVGPATDTRRASWHQQAARLLADQVFESPRLVLQQAGEYLRTGPVRTLREFEDSRGHRLDDALARVEAPVVIVRGEHDPIAPRDWCDRLALARPGTRVVEVAGSGHCAHHRQPVAVARIARAMAPA